MPKNPYEQLRNNILASLASQKPATGVGQEQPEEGVVANVTLRSAGQLADSQGRAALMREYRGAGADPTIPSITPDLADSKIAEMVVPEITRQLQQIENAAGISNDLNPLPLPQRIKRANKIQEMIAQQQEQQQALARESTLGGWIRRLFSRIKPQGWDPKPGGFKYR